MYNISHKSELPIWRLALVYLERTNWRESQWFAIDERLEEIWERSDRSSQREPCSAGTEHLEDSSMAHHFPTLYEPFSPDILQIAMDETENTASQGFLSPKAVNEYEEAKAEREKLIQKKRSKAKIAKSIITSALILGAIYYYLTNAGYINSSMYLEIIFFAIGAGFMLRNLWSDEHGEFADQFDRDQVMTTSAGIFGPRVFLIPTSPALRALIGYVAITLLTVSLFAGGHTLRKAAIKQYDQICKLESFSQNGVDKAIDAMESCMRLKGIKDYNFTNDFILR